MSILKKEKSKKIPTIKNNLFMLKILWEISPKIIIYTFIPEFLGFASWAAFNVLFMKYIFSGLYEISFLSSVLFVVGFAVFTAIVTIVSNWSGDRFKRKMEPKIHQKINKMMFDKASSVDIACFETPEFYDDYTKATVEAYTRAISVLNSTSNLIGALFASLWVIGSMFQINVIAGIFAFLPMIGNFFFGKILNRLYYNQNLDNVPYKRRQDYANRAMYLQKFAKEMRLSKIFGVIKDIYISGYDGIIKNVNKYRVPIFWLSDTRNALCFPVVFEGMWLFAAYLAMVTKTILITEFAVLARSIVSTTWMLTAFTDSLNNCLQNGLYVENLKDFLNYKADIPEEQDGLPVPQFIESLELKSVSFLYKGSKETVIKNVSILLSAGEKVSLVGHNGAGKSTLIKLIMRFYDPTSGVILLNGRDIRLYNLKAYRGLIGTTFQDFQMLSMTVAENVLLSEVTTEKEREQAVNSLKMSGVYDKIETFPQKEDTLLTREFDDNGAVLSGGEFQKIAVARAFAKDSPIVLLDEPSSALDPVAEYQMYETIMSLSDSVVKATGQKRLSVIISHRLSSASMADRIYLLENGAVIEEGGHKSLIKQNGVYADMYKKQAESYLRTVELEDE